MQNKKITIWYWIEWDIISAIFTIATAVAIISTRTNKTIYIFIMTGELLGTSIPRPDAKTPAAGDIGQ